MKISSFLYYVTISFACLVICLSTIRTQAQSVQLKWANSIGAGPAEIVSYSVNDDEGNLYITGMFEGEVDFDPGDQKYTLTSEGYQDIFIMKLNADGSLDWAKSIGNDQNGGIYNEKSLCLKVDVNGNVIVAGNFGSSIDFDPGPDSFLLNTSGSSDIFLLKLNKNGDFIWAKSIEGTTGVHCAAIEVDDLGDVYVTGTFTGRTDFDPGPGSYFMTNVCSADAFVFKLSEDGSFRWATRSMAGTEGAGVNSICTDNKGGLFLTGWFKGKAYYFSSTGLEMQSKGGRDVYVQKIDIWGNYKWAKFFGGKTDELGKSVSADALGNVYTVGEFAGSADFDPGSSNTDLTSNGLTDVFVHKSDGNGNFLWAKSIGGVATDEVSSVTNDASGSAYISGSFMNTVDFNPGSEMFEITSHNPWRSDAYVLNLHPSGEFNEVYQVGGIERNRGFFVSTDRNYNIYLTGDFYGTADFDPNAGTFNLRSNGLVDLFMLKLDQLALGIGQDLSKIKNLSIYPNPNQGRFVVDLSQFSTEVELSISDYTGKEVYRKTAQKGMIEISLDLQPGLYILQAISDGDRISERVLID